MIAFAKRNGIKLNIEMKPAGHEQEFEQKVAKIIETEKFMDQCVVTSQVYDVLEKMKAYDSRIRTAYVMSIAYGDLNALTAADHFSIEASRLMTLAQYPNNTEKSAICAKLLKLPSY